MEEIKTPQHTGADSPLEFLSDADERELARVGKKSVLKVSVEAAKMSTLTREKRAAFIFVTVSL